MNREVIYCLVLEYSVGCPADSQDNGHICLLIPQMTGGRIFGWSRREGFCLWNSFPVFPWLNLAQKSFPVSPLGFSNDVAIMAAVLHESFILYACLWYYFHIWHWAFIVSPPGGVCAKGGVGRLILSVVSVTWINEWSPLFTCPSIPWCLLCISHCSSVGWTVNKTGKILAFMEHTF